MGFLTKLLQAIGFVPSVITAIEHLFKNGSGSQKKDAVMSFLSSALSIADAVAAKEVVDEAGFKSGLSKIVDGVVDVLNASVWAPKAQ